MEFSFNILLPSPVPTTHGIPSSLDTMAAWQVTPPSSVMIPSALFIAGTMSGVVITVTSTSPFSILSSSSVFLTILTAPDAIPGLAPNPLAMIILSVDPSSL